MYCYKHPKTYSVATCGSCGAGICKRCVDHSVYTYDNRPLCYNCNLKAAEDEMSTLGRRKVWSLLKCIFVLGFMILGFSMWHSTGDAMNAWIYAGIGGIPSAFKSTSGTRVHVHNGDIIDTLYYPMMYFLIRLIIILLFAPIAAFFLVIMNLVNFVQNSSALNKARETYNYLRVNPEPPASSSSSCSIEDLDDNDDRWLHTFANTSPSKPSIPKLNFKRPDTL